MLLVSLLRSTTDPVSIWRPQMTDKVALPSSQCGPTAPYRRLLASSALPPCLAAPWPGKKNKEASIEEAIKECKGKESSWDTGWKEHRKSTLLRTGVRDPCQWNCKPSVFWVWNTLSSIIFKLTTLFLFILLNWKPVIIEGWHVWTLPPSFSEVHLSKACYMNPDVYCSTSAFLTLP